MKQTYRTKFFTSNRIFYMMNFLIMLFIFIIYSWPMWFVIIASFSDPAEIALGKVWLWPQGFHVKGYGLVFQDSDIIVGYVNTVLYTVVGTFINMILTICAAYPLSKMNFMPRKFLTIMFVFTMYFSGGMIPTYLQVRDLGLIDTFWAMIIPGAVSIFNVLLLRSFFMYSIPKSLEEAAVLDGANTLQMLYKVDLPLVKPTLAVLVLYYAVGHWNDYFSALLYLSDRKLLPLQTILREKLIVGKIDVSTSGLEATAIMEKLKIAGTLKYSVIIVSILPLLIVYPFVQKYFVKGIMLGAVKG